MKQHIEQWKQFEVNLEGPSEGNPFVEVWLKAIFKQGNREVEVKGFYGGEGLYKIRYMPDQIGQWSFKTESNIESLNSLEGHFKCVKAEGDNHGPVIISEKTHFSYADGKPYYPFGTTAYVWNYQSEEVQEQTYKSLESAPFNKIRMCVFPKHYDYNLQEPAFFPFVGSLNEGFDFEQLNTKFFDKLEEQIKRLDSLNIEVDLILFHPYDRWGFENMGKEADERYLSYVIARLASFKNIWWSLANEYDLVESRSMTEWDDLFKLVKREDPSHHLASIHNWHNPPIHYRNNNHWYDHNKPWVSHASIQHADLFFVPKWIDMYKKPVMIDECRYEGNINHGWGNITSQKMAQLFWEGICRGGYVTHGETYMNPEEIIWWSHGGTLIGDSLSRIAFLRNIIEEGIPKRFQAIGRESSHWEMAIGAINDEYILAYIGDSQPSFKVLEMLPEGVSYNGELIDTWNMTITQIPGNITNKTRVELPSKPYMAIRLMRNEIK